MKLFTEALALDPNDAELWYNRSMSSRYTSRFGRALQDIERAVELIRELNWQSNLMRHWKVNRELAKESTKLRGADFTLDPTREQEDLFQQGMKSMEASQWDEAKQALQASTP